MTIIKKHLCIIILLTASCIWGGQFQTKDGNSYRFNLSNSSVFSPGNDITIDLFSNYPGESVYHFKLFKVIDYDNFVLTANMKNTGNNFDIWGRNGQDILKYTKLVKEWDDLIYTSSNNDNHNVKIGRIDDPGDYIIQAVKDSSVAYCGVEVSNLTMIYKTGKGQILAVVTDNKSGKILTGVKFKIFDTDGQPGEAVADKNGVLLFTEDGTTKSISSNTIIIANTGSENILSSPYFYSGYEQNNYIGYTYTNQPVYRPGQHVYFKSVLRDRKNGALINLPEEEFSITIKSPKDIDIYSKTLKTTEYGTLSGDLILDNDADPGSYSINITGNGQNYYSSFSVEEYKKPEYFVKVETGKNSFAYNDTIKASISAGYYFGSPVTSGYVDIKIFKQNIWHPWWYGSDYSWFYKSFAGRNYNPSELITQMSGELDKDGKFNLVYPVNGDLKSDYNYIIVAEVTDKSRNTVSGTTTVRITRGSFTISTSPEKNYSSTGNLINIRVNAFDFSDKPVSTRFKAAFNYPEQRKDDGTYYKPIGDTLSGVTDSLGKAEISFLPGGLYYGNYNYTVIAYDEKGRKITAEGSFYIGDYEAYRNGGSPEIITDKESYVLGDTLDAFISLPQNDADVLISYEKNSFLGYEVRHVEGKKLELNLKLTDAKFSPNFNIAIVFIKDGQIYNYSKAVNVLDKSKFLNISLKPSSGTYKPGETAVYKVTVTDSKGNSVPNTEISFGIVDESIYAIKEDPAEDIKSIFYSPEYLYMPLHNSRQGRSSFGASRRTTLIDKLIDIKNISPDGNSALSGRLINYPGFDFSNIYVLLNNDKYFYMVKADTSGKFLFKNIKEGEYSILVLLNYGAMHDVGNVIAGRDSVKDIFIGNLENVPQRYFSMRNGGGKSITADLMVTAPRAMGKSSEQFVQPELRTNFVDAVIWKAHVVTDGDGKAEIKFKMPDNLTAWQATVRGITTDSKVGQNTDKTITRKNLIVRLETSRFFREGDEISVSTIVHNYLSESKKVKVNFNVSNLEILNSKSEQAGLVSSGSKANRSCEIVVDKDSDARIDWIVKVNKPAGNATITAEALTNEESDAVELNIPIQSAGIKKSEPLVWDNTNEGVANLEFNIPSGVNMKTAKLSFSAAPSLAGTILKALDDLAGYPYGCVEQTMSRFLPTIITAKTFKEINAPLKSKTIAELPKMVDAGLKRLYNLQHEDGGWGWWSVDETHPYMTAYVIYGMSLAKAAGYNVDTNSFNNGINSLITQLKNNRQLNFTTKAFMLYSLSTIAKQDRRFNDSLVKQMAVQLLKQRLNPYALSLLAITFNNFKDTGNLEEALSKLSKSATEENSYAYWKGKEWHYSWQEDKVQSTAFAVKALMLDKQYSPLISKAVRWLIQQKQGFSWHSTQETSTVIFALTDYLKTTNELNPDFTASIYINNKKSFEKHFTKDDVYENIPSTILNGLNNDELKQGVNKIKIVKTGTGKLYFSGLNTYYTQGQNKPADKNKFVVTRNYFVLNPVDEGDKIVYEKEPLKGEVKSGQVLFVQTKVESNEDNLQYFILEDMLPSGFEAVKDESIYEIKRNEEASQNKKRYIPVVNPYYADKQYHDDRVSFFVTNTKSQMEFSYMIRAEIPGKINVNPAQGYLMYYPEIYGNSSTEKITVKE
ncbi:MAG: alpha-2-macroglobulin family protein [Ignavibacteriaceae bacterium]|nr:alpha-2-macroglobulin family protein [Ignavibacteriaceae bacterium]